ncbi:MAG: TatD family hydrolase [Patescibacteria group bacterium]|nr:TatD family hydrolase [Patescibacteria group bacterium]
MLIDTHSHLNFRAFEQDRGEVISRCLEQGIWILNASSNYETSKLAVEIAERYEKGVYASVGLHPLNATVNLSEHAEDRIEENFNAGKYRELAKSKKVVAIGEIGLDCWYEPKSKTKAEQYGNKQKEAMLAQMDLAGEIDLPVIFHCRKAHQNLIEILKSEARNPKLKGMVHCFTGNWQQAQEYLAMGLYLGFNGIIYKMDLSEVIKKTPLDRILLETDCPFLSPPSVSDRNEPANVRYIARTIAEIRGEPLEKIADATTKNAKKLFNIAL